MAKIFSFCLYGTDPKYYTGMAANVALITEHFPDYEIWVYASRTNTLQSGIDPWVCMPSVRMRWSDMTNGALMYERYMPLEDPTVDICFVRDADSRVDARDRWCISEFLKSSYSFHTIRDHYYHKSRLTGGLTGWRKGAIDALAQKSGDADIAACIPMTFVYGDDEKFLTAWLYPKIKEHLMIHTNINAFLGENSYRITTPQSGPTDFCGQVIRADGTPQFQYDDFPKAKQIHWLHAENQHELLALIYDMWNIANSPYDERTGVLDEAFIANWWLGKQDKCQEILKGYEIAEITPHSAYNASFIFDYWLGKGVKIIGTADPEREPADGEAVIVYGNYPHWYHMLPHSRKLYRNVQALFDRPRHTVYEFDPCWAPVDKIYILNLEERYDRFVETVLELARMRAPLHRIVHYRAKKDGRSPYYGATKNHVDAVEMFLNSPHKNCLILEDDFCFTGRVADTKAALTKFWERAYDYDMCFLSASKSGRREIHDDLLLRTYQVCTTSSGYFLSKPRAAAVFQVMKEGYDLMVKTGDTNTYCIDRYWYKLVHAHRMFLFREKIGFQRATYSNIQGRVTYNLD
jgi:hypothetical protein